MLVLIVSRLLLIFKSLIDFIRRASYMLEHEDILFAQFLINIGFDGYHGEAEYDCDMRYRALRVLQTIVDTATLEKLTKRDINVFRCKHMAAHIASYSPFFSLSFSKFSL